MKLSDLHPSKFLAADDIEGDTTATISRLIIESMKSKDGKNEEKPVLFFKGVQKGMVLNKTNATRIAAIHGDETDLWVGKQITLIVESVDAFGETKWAIRVKPSPPRSTKQSAFPKATPEDLVNDTQAHDPGTDVGF